MSSYFYENRSQCFLFTFESLGLCNILGTMEDFNKCLLAEHHFFKWHRGGKSNMRIQFILYLLGNMH